MRRLTKAVAGLGLTLLLALLPVACSGPQPGGQGGVWDQSNWDGANWQ